MYRYLAAFGILVLFLVLSGCAALQGGVTQEPRVKTLGVLPVMVDVETIDYSAREELAALLRRGTADVDNRVVEELREKGDYFDVRLIDVPADELLAQIVATRVRVGDDDTAHNAYTFNPEMMTRLAGDNLVDAILVVIVNGINRPEKRWKEGRFTLDFLEAKYRSVLYWAVVVAPPAEHLWTREQPPGDVFLRLDYPDFSEAYWNATDDVKVKEITLPGLDRTLNKLEEGMTTPVLYNDMVRSLVRGLKKAM